MPGAACRGLGELFDPLDPDDESDRTSAEVAAMRVCERQCPVLAQCRRWFKSLPDSRKPTGVVAGRVYRRQQEGGTIRVTVKPKARRARVRKAAA